MAIKKRFGAFINSDKGGLICFDKKHLILIYLLFGFFIIAILAGLHGYSISFWRDYIDGSAKDEILFGRARVIRSDDWAVEIPMMLAQLSHNPKYPVVNENIGTGMNMLTHSKVPVKSILTFFRPTTWGFFAGPDFGLSWMWWTMVLGVFYIFFLVFMIISRNDFYLSLLACLFLLFSSFFQFWSFHKAEIPIFMGLIFIAFSFLCFSRKKQTIIIHGVVLGWALSCYALNFIYPPFQLSCACLLLFMMIAIIADRCREYDMRKNWTYRLAGLAIAAVIFAYAGITYYATAQDVIKIMMNTVYPGQRFSTGGDQNLGILFRDIFFSLFYITHTDIKWGVLGNICETSSFLFFFPPVIAAILWQTISNRRIINKFSIIMIGYFLILLFYILVGFTPAISKYSLFYMMPSGRAIMGLGIANTIIIVAFLSGHEKRPGRIARMVIAGLWFIALCAIGRQLGKDFDQISFPYAVAVSIITAILTYYLLNTEKKKTVITIFAGISFAATAWFNPLVLKGTAFIYENNLSKEIIEINRLENGNTNWAAFSPWITPNLFRMTGIKSVNGSHAQPMFGLWEKIDPQRQYFQEYNRYAQVNFVPSATGNIRFHSPFPDQLYVYINPNSDVLEQLKVTHILATDENIAFFDGNKRFQKLWTYGNKAIYKLIH